MSEKCEYLTEGNKCGKGAPCDEDYIGLMACPAVHSIIPEELPKPYKPKFVDLNKIKKINPGWMR